MTLLLASVFKAFINALVGEPFHKGCVRNIRPVLSRVQPDNEQPILSISVSWTICRACISSKSLTRVFCMQCVSSDATRRTSEFRDVRQELE